MQRVEDAYGELQVCRQFGQAQLAAQEQDLGQQFDQEQEGQAGFVDRARRRRNGARGGARGRQLVV